MSVQNIAAARAQRALRPVWNFGQEPHSVSSVPQSAETKAAVAAAAAPRCPAHFLTCLVPCSPASLAQTRARQPKNKNQKRFSNTDHPPKSKTRARRRFIQRWALVASAIFADQGSSDGCIIKLGWPMLSIGRITVVESNGDDDRRMRGTTLTDRAMRNATESRSCLLDGVTTVRVMRTFSRSLRVGVTEQGKRKKPRVLNPRSCSRRTTVIHFRSQRAPDCRTKEPFLCHTGPASRFLALRPSQIAAISHVHAALPPFWSGPLRQPRR